MARVDVQEHGDKAGLNTPGGAELQRAMGSKGLGLPFFAFLDASGKLIVNSLRPVRGKPAGVNIGHPFEPEEVDWFMVMLGKAVPALTPGETRPIESYLRNQKSKPPSTRSRNSPRH
jgi:hypothetical protein